MSTIYFAIAFFVSLFCCGLLLDSFWLTVIGLTGNNLALIIVIHKEQKENRAFQKTINDTLSLIDRRTQSNYDRLNTYFDEASREAQSNLSKTTNFIAKTRQAINEAQVTNNHQIKQLRLARASSLKRSSTCADDSKTFVFIDNSNFYHSCQDVKIDPDYASLMIELTKGSSSYELRIYFGVFDPPAKRQSSLIKELNNLGYQVIKHPIGTVNGKQKIIGDDNQLTCDLLMMILGGEITTNDKVVLVSGDGDFYPLLEIIKAQGVKLDLVAHRPSQHLTSLVDQVIDLNQIKYDICQIAKI